MHRSSTLFSAALRKADCVEVSVRCGFGGHKWLRVSKAEVARQHASQPWPEADYADDESIACHDDGALVWELDGNRVLSLY